MRLIAIAIPYNGNRVINRNCNRKFSSLVPSYLDNLRNH